MAKTDENDARILQQVPLDEFRECSLDFLRLKELLMVYRKLQRRVRKIRQWDNDVHLQSSKDYISEAKEKMAEIEDEIHKIAMGSLPMYREVLQFIGSEKSIDVAELLTLLDVSRGFKKLRRFTGHLASKKKTKTGKTIAKKPKRYSHKARRCLQDLANRIIASEMAHQKYGKHSDRLWCQIYKEIRSKKRLSLRIQITILKCIRGLVRTQNQAAGRA